MYDSVTVLCSLALNGEGHSSLESKGRGQAPIRRRDPKVFRSEGYEVFEIDNPQSMKTSYYFRNPPIVLEGRTVKLDSYKVAAIFRRYLQEELKLRGFIGSLMVIKRAIKDYEKTGWWETTQGLAYVTKSKSDAVLFKLSGWNMILEKVEEDLRKVGIIS